MSCMKLGWNVLMVNCSIQLLLAFILPPIGDEVYKWKWTGYIIFFTFIQKLSAWISETEERLYDILNGIDGVAPDVSAMNTSSGGNQYCAVRFTLVKKDITCHGFWKVAQKIQTITEDLWLILTYWSLNKMDAIFQTTFPKASWKWLYLHSSFITVCY